MLKRLCHSIVARRSSPHELTHTQTTEGVSLAAIAIALLSTLLMWVGAAQASAASNDGLPPGATVPSWAASKHIHFYPSAPSTSLGTPIFGKPAAEGGHNHLGRRCEPGYCPTPPLLYKGGKGVQHNPTLYLIFWGKNWNSTGAGLENELLHFYEGLNGSAYQGILTQYYDNSGYITGGEVLAGAYTDESVSAPSSVNDSALQAEVAAAVKANKWTRNFNAQFIVFPAPGSTYESSFGSSFCAYHSVDSAGSSYTFAPYVGDEPFKHQCSGYDPSNNVNHVTSMLASHEYSEAATDPNPYGSFATWQTSDGYEIGDICASGDDQLPNGSWVQGEWDNFQNACSLSDPETHPSVPQTRPATILQPNGSQDIYFRGSNNEIWSWVYTASTGKWAFYEIGGSAASDPTAFLQSNGNQNIYYTGTNGAIIELLYTASTNKYTFYEIGGAAVGVPTAFLQSNGNQNIYYRDSSGAIWELLYTASNNKWTFYKLGGSAAGNPTAFLQANGNQNVFFRGTEGGIWTWVYTASTNKWALYDLGGEAASDPTAFLQPTSGNQNVYFRDTHGAIWELLYTTSNNKWTLYDIGGSAAVGDPTAYLLSNGDQNVFYRDAKGAIWELHYTASTGKWTFYDIGGSAAAGDPAAFAQSSGYQNVYFRSPTGATWELLYTPSENSWTYYEI